MKEEFKELIKKSYAPLSNYQVASIIVGTKGIGRGVNIECSSFKDGLCAEQIALNDYFSKGYKKEDIKEVLVYNQRKMAATPCFLCRQYLVEFLNDDVLIKTYNIDFEESIYKLSDLCPYKFSLDNLEEE